MRSLSSTDDRYVPPKPCALLRACTRQQVLTSGDGISRARELRGLKPRKGVDLSFFGTAAIGRNSPGQSVGGGHQTGVTVTCGKDYRAESNRYAMSNSRGEIKHERQMIRNWCGVYVSPLSEGERSDADYAGDRGGGGESTVSRLRGSLYSTMKPGLVRLE